MSQEREQGRDPVDALVELEEIGGGGGGGRKRWTRVALWCALVGVMVAAVAVVVLRDPAPSPDEELARIRGFVASAGTGRFVGSSRSETGRGPDEPGSTSIEVSGIEGSFQLPDRMHFVEDAGDYLFESILVGKGTYYREGDTRPELQAEAWEYEAIPEAGGGGYFSAEGVDEAGAAALSAASGVFGAFGAPFDLAEVLGRLDNVRRVSAGVLEARVTARDFLPPEMVEQMERAMEEAERESTDAGDDVDVEMDTNFIDDPVTIRLLHARDGRLDEMVITAESNDGEERSVEHSSLRFSEWGEPARIAAPSVAEVDLTPGIDEEELAAFRGFTLLAPKAPPPGTVLESASIVEEDAEIESCASVDLEYGPPSPGGSAETPGPRDGLGPFLHLSLMAKSCPWADDVVGHVGFNGATETVRIGAYEGQVLRSPLPARGGGEALLHFRLAAGAVVVEATTNLPQDQVVAALATLGPLDLASQPLARSEPPPGG